MQDKALQLVFYEQAQKLKKLGFDWVDFDYKYHPLELTNNRIPTIAIALKWFRDERKIFNCIRIMIMQIITMNTMLNI